MSAATTLAPSRTNTFTDAFAIPDPAPVMTATLPSSSPIEDPPGLWSACADIRAASMTPIRPRALRVDDAFRTIAPSEGEMMDLATGIYSCDDHLDLRAVPPELWAVAPVAAPTPSAGRTWSSATASRSGCARTACSAGAGTRANGALLKSLSAIGRAGIEDDGYRAGSPELRLQDMDRDGLAASVIYGPLALGLPDRRSRAAGPLLRGVERLGGRGVQRGRARPAVRAARSCPATRPRPRSAELERCAALGHRGAIIDIFGMDIGDRAWDRAVGGGRERTGIPISFHLKGGSWSGLSYRWGSGSRPRSPPCCRSSSTSPWRRCCSPAALERHPELTLVLAESGVGWLPYFLARADLEWESLRDKIADMPAIPPSELFRRQVMATFEEDALGDRADPAARRRLVHVGVGLPAHRQHVPQLAARDRRDARRAVRRTTASKVTATNCAELYGFARRA